MMVSSASAFSRPPVSESWSTSGKTTAPTKSKQKKKQNTYPLDHLHDGSEYLVGSPIVGVPDALGDVLQGRTDRGRRGDDPPGRHRHLGGLRSEDPGGQTGDAGLDPVPEQLPLPQQPFGLPPLELGRRLPLAARRRSLADVPRSVRTRVGAVHVVDVQPAARFLEFLEERPEELEAGAPFRGDDIGLGDVEEARQDQIADDPLVDLVAGGLDSLDDRDTPLVIRTGDARCRVRRHLDHRPQQGRQLVLDGRCAAAPALLPPGMLHHVVEGVDDPAFQILHGQFSRIVHQFLVPVLELGGHLRGRVVVVAHLIILLALEFGKAREIVPEDIAAATGAAIAGTKHCFEAGSVWCGSFV